MMGPALEFNRPGLETQLPGYLKNLEQRAAANPALKPTLDEDRFFLDQKRTSTTRFPNVTFSDRLTIELGERHIEVLHYDRAVTPGDAFVYLPREKVLLIGDLIVNPVTFALSGYPTEWLRTLEKIDRLDFTTMVTGHGSAAARSRAPARDHGRVPRAAARRKSREGERDDADQAKEAIFPIAPRADGRRSPADDASRTAAFKQQLVDWYLHRVYEELDGPLTDGICCDPAVMN